MKQPKVLIPRQEIERRVAELAAEIERDYSPGRTADDPLLAVGVLQGSVFFLVDLLKHVRELPVAVDFFQTSSYRGGTSPGEVRVRKDIDTWIRGRDVLLVEDIVDTGYTLRTILDMLRFRGARSVKLCALLDKRAARRVEVPIDYLGFPIDDVFVVGYGLDYEGLYRNLPYIGVLDDDGEPGDAP
ncbi:MAG TPA: hypoxanthine phosphoribosyltransferase [Thermoanaerobaculia bacterium]